MGEKGVAMIMGALMFYKKYGALKGAKQVTEQDSYFSYPTSQEMNRWNNQGIVFSNDIVKTYTDLFTTKNSSQENKLQEIIVQASENKSIVTKSKYLKAA